MCCAGKVCSEAMDHGRAHIVGQPLFVAGSVSGAPWLVSVGGVAVNYYERHLGDYARDTGHLSMVEHGAYTLLLDRCYATEQGIPQDQAYRIARARTKEEREAVDVVLAEFFTLQDGVHVQRRVQGEIEKARHRIEAARSNGRNGGRPRKKPTGFSNETQEKPTGFSLGSVSETQSKALQTPSTSSEAKASGADAPQQPSGQQPPDPKKALWDLGVSILGEKSRPVIGAACKRVGEQRVAEVFAQMAADPKADPVAWFVRVTSDRPARLVV